MFENLRKLNPQIPFYSVHDMEFSQYGSVISNIDVTKLIEECNEITFEGEKSTYQASIGVLENLEISKEIKEKIFGGLDIQTGLCHGYNDRLNAFEYHKSSEVNVAITPIVLILGLVSEMENGRYNTQNAKAFFMDKGEMIEVYGGTLHFCPCQVNKSGFLCVVILNKGTNEELDFISKDNYLFKKNKWIICHEDNETLRKRGVLGGIYGENYRIVGEKT